MNKETGRVTSLDLKSKALRGEIPWQLLSMLGALKYLYLNNNRLTGALLPDPAVRPLESLVVLDVSDNWLDGR